MAAERALKGAVKSDAELATLLVAANVDPEIPVAAFRAVADILAYLHKLDGTPQDGVPLVPLPPVR